MKKKQPVKHKISMIKYQAKQKHLLPFHVANNKLKYFYIENIN